MAVIFHTIIGTTLSCRVGVSTTTMDSIIIQIIFGDTQITTHTMEVPTQKDHTTTLIAEEDQITIL